MRQYSQSMAVMVERTSGAGSRAGKAISPLARTG